MSWLCAKPCRDSFQGHEIDDFDVLIQELQDRYQDHLVKNTTGHRKSLRFNTFVRLHRFNAEEVHCLRASVRENRSSCGQ